MINLENTDDVSNRLLYNEMDLWHPIKVGAVKNPKIEQQRRMKVDGKYDVACREFKQRLFYQTKQEFCSKGISEGINKEYLKRLQQFSGLTIEKDDFDKIPPA